MTLFGREFKNIIKGSFYCLVPILILFGLPNPAYADWALVDAVNLAPFVPVVLDALMMVATGVYEYFVGNGDGILYIMVWGFLGFTIGIYLVKMYFPKNWLGFFGISDGGEMWDKDGITGFKIAEEVLKPAVRAIFATLLLLQIKPIYVTEWIIDPFLRFGAIYTESILETVNAGGADLEKFSCPPDIVQKGWISEDSCNFLVQPVAQLSHTNNQVIKVGFDYVNQGILGMMRIIPNGGKDFLNLLTGVLLIITFVSSNFFMALLIIQGIFRFGMSLMMYPFKVIVWVMKKSDKWLDPWPPFEDIIEALKRLIITMIACAFILVINIAIIKALFKWNNSVFVVAAGGFSTSNVPVGTAASMGFGEHSILWLSTILTFYLMYRIFDLTKEKLNSYAGDGATQLHDNVMKDAKTTWSGVKDMAGKIGKATGWGKK